jgi:hypothetical protein
MVTHLENPYRTPKSSTLTAPIKKSRIAIGVALLPALLMLALYYSLAIHMYQSLGAWPTTIGERGFPSPLIIHANVAMGYFSIWLLVTVFVWPVAFLICLLIRRFRFLLCYLGAYALSCAICFGATLLAPAQFLYWWWD